MPAGLSHIQKREIAIAARRAYDAWAEREAFEAINSEMSRSACFDAWRHVEQGKATGGNGSGPAGGIQSLCEMTQAHYAAVLAHFIALAGDPARADRVLTRNQDNGRRIARYKLDQILRERGLPAGYAASICRSKFKCALDQASEGQIWKLFYDVRKRPVPAQMATPAADNDDPF